ncbi:TPA: hypothetical protein ACQVH3_003736 [Serratia marcescens]
MLTIEQLRAEMIGKIALASGLRARDGRNVVAEAIYDEVVAPLLANWEAQPVQVTDGMALDFHHALTDSDIGKDDLEEIKIGLRAALCNVNALLTPRDAQPDDKPFGYYSKETAAILERRGFAPISANPLVDHSIPLYTAPPAPAVPDGVMPGGLVYSSALPKFESSDSDKIVGYCCFISGETRSVESQEQAYADAKAVINACRAAMLAEEKCECSSIDYCGDCLRKMSVQPVRQVPDGWVMVPFEPTRQMMSQGHFAMGGTDRGKFRRIYQAMVNAAPEAK